MTVLQYIKVLRNPAGIILNTVKSAEHLKAACNSPSLHNGGMALFIFPLDMKSAEEVFKPF